MKKIFITGISSGLGEALANVALERGDQVYAVGRHDNKLFINKPGYYFYPVDLLDIEMIRENLKEFVRMHEYDLVILNAGILGEIREMSEISLKEAKAVMDLNLWANKQIIDTLDLHAKSKQVVAVSLQSGTQHDDQSLRSRETLDPLQRHRPRRRHDSHAQKDP